MRYIVNAVVVTYNRLELLKQTISCLENQTYPIDTIVIINNASTDGTDEYLKELKYENVAVKTMEKNLGGAGGFYYGIGEAYEHECDFVWIMDDDTLCSPKALETLIEAYQFISEKSDRKIGFLTSDARFTDGSPCLMNICGPAYIYNDYLAEGIVCVTHSSFVAMLIPSAVIREVGLPYKEFFIWGDDGEYSTRITHKYPGYVVGRSIVTHKMKENVGVDIFNTPAERIGRFFYFYRNWAFISKTRGKKALLRYLKDNIKLTIRLLLSRTDKRLKKIGTVWKGVFAGLRFKAELHTIEDYEKGLASGYETENSKGR